jgi:hypothetical protein
VLSEFAMIWVEGEVFERDMLGVIDVLVVAEREVVR